MNISVVPESQKRPAAEVAVWPFFMEKKEARLAIETEALPAQIKAPIALGDFKGKEGEILLLYSDQGPEKRIMLLGLGAKEKATVEGLRRAYAAATKACLQKKVESANLILPKIEPLNQE